MPIMTGSEPAGLGGAAPKAKPAIAVVARPVAVIVAHKPDGAKQAHKADGDKQAHKPG